MNCPVAGVDSVTLFFSFLYVTRKRPAANTGSERDGSCRYIVMACLVMAYAVRVYLVLAYVVMACTATACIVMAHIVMACVVMVCVAVAYKVMPDP